MAPAAIDELPNVAAKLHVATHQRVLEMCTFPWHIHFIVVTKPLECVACLRVIDAHNSALAAFVPQPVTFVPSSGQGAATATTTASIAIAATAIAAIAIGS